jgi:hypothetical protein
MPKRIIAVWCFLCATSALFSMNQEIANIPKQHTSPAAFTTLPEDILISIIVFSMHEQDINKQLNASPTQRIMRLIKTIMTLREVSTTFAHALTPNNIILILDELPYARNLLNEQPSLALPLYSAARDNKVLGVRIILQLCKDNVTRIALVNHAFPEREQRTPALIAAHRGNIATMHIMMPYTQLNHVDIYGRNSLMLAARSESWRGMQLLLASGADTNHQDSIHRGIQAYTQTPQTRATRNYYETLKDTLAAFPLELIALVYSYLVESKLSKSKV